jgi:hypothetical protein
MFVSPVKARGGKDEGIEAADVEAANVKALSAG